MNRLPVWLTMWLILAGRQLLAQYSPPGSPQFELTWQVAPRGTEHFFMGAYRIAPPFYLQATNFLLDPAGQTVWYQQGDLWALDFKLHPNGRMAYSDNRYWHVLDSNFEEVDSVICRNGYLTDDHDFLMRADGHAFLVCLEDTTMDLSGLTTATGGQGSPSGTLQAVVIQELDGAKNVVKEWHGRDHFQPQEARQDYFTNPNRLELNHTNSVEIDSNGHMLLSHRALDAVTLVDWGSGEVLWQLGGDGNDFDLQGDVGLKGQHDARFLDNGEISLFDNGNGLHAPRGMVYAVDTNLWRATVRRSHVATSAFTDGMGSMRVQANGDALIGMGLMYPFSAPSVMAMAPDSSLLFALHFADSSSTYRFQSAALPFALHRPRLTCDIVSGMVILGLEDPATSYQWSNGSTAANIVVTAPGWYQAFVPQGIGMMGSEPLWIDNVNNACLALDAQQPQTAAPKPRKSIGYYDILGLPVKQFQPWQVVIEVFDDGSTRKIVRQ